MFSVLFRLAPQMYYSGQSGTWEVFSPVTGFSNPIYAQIHIYAHQLGKPKVSGTPFAMETPSI